MQQCPPAGRYAPFSKSGDGVSVNLEYIIQIGATAELILDGTVALSHPDAAPQEDFLCSAKPVTLLSLCKPPAAGPGRRGARLEPYGSKILWRRLEAIA